MPEHRGKRIGEYNYFCVMPEVANGQRRTVLHSVDATIVGSSDSSIRRPWFCPDCESRGPRTKLSVTEPSVKY